jgi:hypothetical protein
MTRAAILKVVSDHTKNAYNESRVEAGLDLSNGDRRTIVSPLDGRKIGQVYRSDPKPVAVVTDEAALLTWYAVTHPDHVRKNYAVIGSEREVIEVLAEHAPHLLRMVQEIAPDTLRKLRADVIKFGHGIGPGGEVEIPGIEQQTDDGVVACKPDDDALGVVLDLFAAHRVGLDGTVRPAITGSLGGPDAA